MTGPLADEVHLAATFSNLREILGPETALRVHGREASGVKEGAHVRVRLDAGLFSVEATPERLPDMNEENLKLIERWSRNANAGLRLAQVTVRGRVVTLGARMPARGLLARAAENAARGLAACIEAVAAAARMLPRAEDLADERILALLRDVKD